MGVVVAVVAASLAALVAPAQASSQTAVMVGDINPGSAQGTTFPLLADVNGTAFFNSDDGTNGNELWKSDGTTAGTTMVKDINPGPAASFPDCGSSCYHYTTLGSNVFFTAYDGVTGRELWKSDGTEAGTVQVADIHPGVGDVYPGPNRLTAVGDTLFFSQDDGIRGRELWKTDGTAAGTVLVKDINPGASGSSAAHSPSFMINLNGTLLFGADDGTSGNELWRSDGTEAGTVQVADGNPGSGSSRLFDAVLVDGTVFFYGDDGTHGAELWRTDGTAAGTEMVLDYLPSITGYGLKPDYLTVFNGAVFFRGSGGNGNGGQPGIGRELWRSDGTAAGTVLVKDIYLGSFDGLGGVDDPGLTVSNGALFFAATDGTTAGGSGKELWKTDGTTAGTVRVKDINPGGGSSIFSTFGDFEPATVNSLLYFAASDGTVGAAEGIEVWQSDGTAAGTVRTADIRPGTASSSPAYFAAVGDTVYFIADDGTHGYEPWRLNGAPAAANDAYTTGEDTTLTVGAPGVLANDSDPNATLITAGSASTPAHGSVALSADGSFTYTPTADYNGPDSFTYTASDADGATATATVTITVSAANDAPTAFDDTVSASEETPLTVAAPGVLGNDIDPDADALSAGSASTPANGTVSLGADGSFTYTPDAGYNGPDAFTYVASDGNGGTDTATVTIAVNDAPTAVDDSASTTEDTPLTVAAPGVLGNDTDGDADPLTAGSASTPANGSVSLSADGSYTYTPDADFNGADSFTYVASDGNGGTDTATVSITVSAVNDAPVAADDAYATAFNTPLTVAAPGTLADDTDADGDPLAAGSATTPANGTVVLSSDGSFTYTPATGYSGTDTFAYTASDGNGGTDTASVTITVAGPAISVGSVAVYEGDAATRAAVFSVTLSAPSATTVTVDYATADASASAGIDYTAKSGTVSFAPGVTSQKVKVPVLGDTGAEADEAFSVVLSAPSGGAIANGTGTGTIVNDDAGTGKRLAIGDVSVHEGNAGTRSTIFTVSLSKASTTTVKVNYTTANGTAVKGTDYTKVSGTLTFAPGVTSMTIAVPILPDASVEGNETFTVNLSAPYGGAVIADAMGLGTVVDDD